MGAHCWECIRAARPSSRQQFRRWNATVGPLATKCLIALNVAVFVFIAAKDGSTAGGGDLQDRLVLNGPAVANGEWYRLVTSGFVHYGWLHLVFNMLVLYQIGMMLEPALGRLRFLAVYVTALLAGSLGALVLSPDDFTAGASGAIFGLAGAAAVGLRLRGFSIWHTGIGWLLAINLIYTFAVPGISIGGHLGGLAAGVVCGAVMLRSAPSRHATAQGIALAAALSAAVVAVALWTVSS